MNKVSTYDEFIKDHQEGKVVDMNNPKCIGCDDCCTMGAAITKKEYKRILKYLSTDVNGIALYKRAKRIILEHREQGIVYFKCPLVIGKRCGIYKIRPQICKDFHCKPELNKLDLDGLTEERRKELDRYIIANLFYEI